MNERIKELWAQGTQTVVPREGDYSSVSAKNIEKFAESIVRECTEICLSMQLGFQYTPEEMLFQTKYRNLIKEHFGVEE